MKDRVDFIVVSSSSENMANVECPETCEEMAMLFFKNSQGEYYARRKSLEELAKEKERYMNSGNNLLKVESLAEYITRKYDGAEIVYVPKGYTAIPEELEK